MQNAKNVLLVNKGTVKIFVQCLCHMDTYNTFSLCRDKRQRPAEWVAKERASGKTCYWILPVAGLPWTVAKWLVPLQQVDHASHAYVYTWSKIAVFCVLIEMPGPSALLLDCSPNTHSLLLRTNLYLIHHSTYVRYETTRYFHWVHSLYIEVGIAAY